MGLLNFRRKSKKSNTIKDSLPKLTFDKNIQQDDNDSGISSAYHSPISDSFIMGSSLSDITSNSLLEDILSELPSTKQNQKSSASSSGK
jgi:hypothetical protein